MRPTLALLLLAALALSALTAAAQPAPSSAVPFDQMTPEAHALAARAAIDLDQCESGEDCRDPVLAVRHFRAIREDYAATHRAELTALRTQIVTAAEEVTALEQDLAARGPAPRPDERGGSYSRIRAYLRTRLDDPRGYQPVRCAAPEEQRDRWSVACTFRARNRVGALILRAMTFAFRGGRVVDAYATDDDR